MNGIYPDYVGPTTEHRRVSLFPDWVGAFSDLLLPPAEWLGGAKVLPMGTGVAMVSQAFGAIVGMVRGSIIVQPKKLDVIARGDIGAEVSSDEEPGT